MLLPKAPTSSASNIDSLRLQFCCILRSQSCIFNTLSAMSSNSGAIPNQPRIVWSMDVYPKLFRACEPPIHKRETLLPTSWPRFNGVAESIGTLLARFSNTAAKINFETVLEDRGRGQKGDFFIYEPQDLVVDLPINKEKCGSIVKRPAQNNVRNREIWLLSSAGSSKINDLDGITRKRTVMLSSDTPRSGERVRCGLWSR